MRSCWARLVGFTGRFRGGGGTQRGAAPRKGAMQGCLLQAGADSIAHCCEPSRPHSSASIRAAEEYRRACTVGGWGRPPPHNCGALLHTWAPVAPCRRRRRRRPASRHTRQIRSRRHARRSFHLKAAAAPWAAAALLTCSSSFGLLLCVAQLFGRLDSFALCALLPRAASQRSADLPRSAESHQRNPIKI
ncbi:MAG: hypothetical protein J3K34DRAFT_161883 [Monoraphidium minutum]|nr:MAG: hypothetical protein J3K34DRAFT_161883 [Monoraphidium minutum]